eukprot:329498-Amorphochlora_amoeboformis.AAC.3
MSCWSMKGVQVQPLEDFEENSQVGMIEIRLVDISKDVSTDSDDSLEPLGRWALAESSFLVIGRIHPSFQPQP